MLNPTGDLSALFAVFLLLSTSSLASPQIASPNGFTQDSWSSALNKARDVVSQMTLDEKVNMTQGTGTSRCGFDLPGVPRLGIPQFCLTGGPSGNRNSHYSSQYPSAITLAATFDRTMAETRGYEMGAEYKAQGVHGAGAVVVGPLGRSPYGGRNWESWSPDPYLTSVMVGLTVKGMQNAGTVAITKHFIGNEQEYLRIGNTITQSGFERNETRTINDVIDDKTIHELYLPPFAEAVRFGTAGVMCSYNKVNGTISCESEYTLGLLKNELNYAGYVVSDFSAVWNGVPAANAGTDFNAPGGPGAGNAWTGSFWQKAIANGTVSQQRLDDAVTRNLLGFYALKQDTNFPTADFNRWVVRDGGIIRDIAREALTLVKNTEGTRGLPILNTTKAIGIFGDCGPRRGGNDPWLNNLFDLPPPNGTLIEGYQTDGGGAGISPPPFIVTPYEAIAPRARAQQALFEQYTATETMIEPIDMAGKVIYPIDTALSRLQKCIVFVSSYAREGYDRRTLDVDNRGNELIAKVAGTCSDTVVVVQTVGQIDMSKWVNHPNVTAILFGYLPGQLGGESLVSVLFGDESPSGRLPWTIAKDVSDYDPNTIYNDTSATGVVNPSTVFSEGTLIDYRYFDKKGIKPQFEFGFGLSYSNFTMSGLKVIAKHIGDIAFIRETNEKFLNGTTTGQGLYDQSHEVYVTLTNTGAMDAKAVVQLYVSAPNSKNAGQPVRTLRGFDKIMLQQGESREIRLSVRNKDLASWSTSEQGWYLQSGVHTFSVGFSSRDLPQQTGVTLG